APLEVEHVLLQHPDVVQAHVVGVADRLKGEIVAAAVELRAGTAPDAVAVIAFCRERLASYKVPARLAFRTAAEFPRTPPAKIPTPGWRGELAPEGGGWGEAGYGGHRREGPPMKIPSFEAATLNTPEDDPLANMPEEAGRTRPIVTVRLRTDNGIEGIGV